eukprot:jgi/Bigna1/80786/fgenesh1_pg.74_\
MAGRGGFEALDDEMDDDGSYLDNERSSDEPAQTVEEQEQRQMQAIDDGLDRIISKTDAIHRTGEDTAAQLIAQGETMRYFLHSALRRVDRLYICGLDIEVLT